MMMKKLFKLLPFMMLAMTFASCDPAEEEKTEPTEREILLNKLGNVTWGNATVTHADDGDLSDMYSLFAIQFNLNESDNSDGSYLVNAGSYAFPQAAGKWSVNEELTQITLSNGQVIDFELSSNTLTLDFTVESANGKSLGVEGHFIFELSAL